MHEHQLRCPEGHHLPDNTLVDPGGQMTLRCNKWKEVSKRECGRWSWFYAVRGGGYIAVAVSLGELSEISKMDSPSTVIDFLGIFADNG